MKAEGRRQKAEGRRQKLELPPKTFPLKRGGLYRVGFGDPSGSTVAYGGDTPFAQLGETPRPQWLPSDQQQLTPSQTPNPKPQTNSLS